MVYKLFRGWKRRQKIALKKKLELPSLVRNKRILPLITLYQMYLVKKLEWPLMIPMLFISITITLVALAWVGLNDLRRFLFERLASKPF